MNAANQRRTVVFVGSYNQGVGAGIYAYELNPVTGAFTRVGSDAVEGVPRVVNPSFLALAPGGRFLYCVCEVPGGGGSVAAFVVEPATLALTKLNEQPSHGSGPCHVSMDATGRVVLVANYGSGSVASYPVQAHGALAPAASVIQHRGSSVDKSRQEGPHAHSIYADPTNRFAFAVDLGLDKVMAYKLDAAWGSLTPAAVPSAAVAAGAGPRHMAFAPGGGHAYVINELNSTITVFACDGAGRLEPVEAVSTLPAGWAGMNYPSEVRVSPDGRFVYGANRGHDSIAVFAVDAARGTLTALGHEPVGGHWPRGFGLTPRGDYLLAANEKSDGVAVFRVDRRSGKLKATGQVLKVPGAACVQGVEI